MVIVGLFGANALGGLSGSLSLELIVGIGSLLLILFQLSYVLF